MNHTPMVSEAAVILNDPKCACEDRRPVEQRIVEVLMVSPLDEDHRQLHQILQHSKWQQHSARTLREALAFLQDHVTPVVICESELPDGTWKDLLFQLDQMKNPPMLVVASRLADEVVWSEVLNLGGYNVLAKPFDSGEVFHAVSFAWLHWKSLLSRTNTKSGRCHSAAA